MNEHIKAEKMRAETRAAFDSLFDALRHANMLLSFSDAEWAAWLQRHERDLDQSFGPPRNPLIIGNPHHNDPLDPEHQQ